MGIQLIIFRQRILRTEETVFLKAAKKKNGCANFSIDTLPYVMHKRPYTFANVHLITGFELLFLCALLLLRFTRMKKNDLVFFQFAQYKLYFNFSFSFFLAWKSNKFLKWCQNLDLAYISISESEIYIVDDSLGYCQN